ncbi:MAG: class I SAM-dependent methyltransferase [Deltaproteobacteria bacterium]|nr:class I SAM-dependent methyltransferase [Deltaproteobacteria bacterium]
MSRRPVLVYSAIIGDYDAPPSVSDASPDVEFILVSDKAPRESPWKPVLIHRFWQDNKLTSGYVKTHPHLFAPPDAISVWVDGNLDEIRIDSDRIRELAGSSPIATLPHLDRQTVKEEAREVTERELDDGWRVQRHMEKLESLGFRDELTLSVTCLVIRDLADPRMRLFNQRWWQSILHGSRRDQLGFDAASWATGIDIHHLDADWREPNDWFIRGKHSGPQGRLAKSAARDRNGVSRRFNLVGLPEAHPEPAYCEEEWTARDLKVIHALNAVVEQAGEPLEGSYCHMHGAGTGPLTPPDPRRSWKREFLRRAVCGVRAYLEIGFAAGHSAAIALLENPELRLQVVDLADHKYSKPCAELLAERFPGRIEFRWGDSKSILRRIRGWKAKNFDLVHIVGGHAEDVFQHDLSWWLSTSKPGNKLLVDDAYVGHMRGRLEAESVAARIRETHPGLPSSGENRLFVRT